MHYLQCWSKCQNNCSLSSVKMIFRRALLRELVYNCLAVSMVLITITLSTLLIRLLGDAARGKLALDAVIAFLGFGLLGFMPVLLSLALFITVIMTVSRAYRDSEMVVWFSAGQSLLGWVRPVLYFAVPVVFAIAALNLAVIPWALQKKDLYQGMLNSRDDMSAISPGMFVESRNADRVYFVESLSQIGTRVKNVFMQSLDNNQLGIVVAKEGFHTELPNGERYLVLENGRRYEGVPGRADYKTVDFGRYWVRIEPTRIVERSSFEPKVLPTSKLVQDPNPANTAELIWRWSFPISAFILALLAIPLSFINPRAGRSFKLILALLIYVIYNNLLGISQAWVAQQKISPLTGMWAVHLLMASLLVWMFYQRISMRTWWRRRQ